MGGLNLERSTSSYKNLLGQKLDEFDIMLEQICFLREWEQQFELALTFLSFRVDNLAANIVDEARDIVSKIHVLISKR